MKKRTKAQQKIAKALGIKEDPILDVEQMTGVIPAPPSISSLNSVLLANMPNTYELIPDNIKNISDLRSIFKVFKLQYINYNNSKEFKKNKHLWKKL